MVMKVMIVIMMMRIITKTMNSSSYLRVFVSSCYKIVSPILLQELIDDFAVCISTVVKHFYLLKM